MLKLLIVKNIALSASVELELAPGLNVLTGETGAGKSLVVDALGLVLGGRGGADLIRTGQKSATVQGLFERPGVAALLESRGLPVEGDELIIRRELSVAGRARASANGALVPVSTLKDLSENLAVIHGQHEHRELLDTETHGALLDAFGGLQTEVDEVASTFAELRAIEKDLESIRAGEKGIAERREILAYQLDEIDRAHLEPGEDERLETEKRIQANAGRLANLSGEAYAALYDDEGAALERIAVVYRRIQELARLDPRFQSHLDGRDAVISSLEDLSLLLRDYQETVAADPRRLDAIESRLAMVDRLKKRHGGSVVSVLAFAESCRDELAASRSPEETVRRLEERRGAAQARYLDLARKLSARRRHAATSLVRRVRKELDELAMEKTHFSVDFGPDPADEGALRANGLEQPQFLISANLGEEPRPLARIASGGELSRILLALRTVEAGADHGVTAVFDEVDSGIGGRVAEVVGRKLKEVSRHRQVLCVTHLAGIASQADAHFAVRKRVAQGRTFSEVEALDDAGRVEEIARMIGGETITPLTRKHAREMIELAGKARIEG